MCSTECRSSYYYYYYYYYMKRNFSTKRSTTMITYSVQRRTFNQRQQQMSTSRLSWRRRMVLSLSTTKTNSRRKIKRPPFKIDHSLRRLTDLRHGARRLHTGSYSIVVRRTQSTLWLSAPSSMLQSLLTAVEPAPWCEPVTNRLSQ